MDDYDLYMKALRSNAVDLCLKLEQQYEVDGYPPNIASAVIRRVCRDGESIEEALSGLSDLDNASF